MKTLTEIITKITVKVKTWLFPSVRNLLVVRDGLYKGEWLVFIGKTPEHTIYYSLPDKYERVIPNKDIEWGLANKVIEIVDVLPKGIYNVCIEDYKNAKQNGSLNRRQQHASSRALDREKYRNALSELQRNQYRKHLYLPENVKDSSTAV